MSRHRRDWLTIISYIVIARSLAFGGATKQSFHRILSSSPSDMLDLQTTLSKVNLKVYTLETSSL
jgi:hypothetical protein